MPLAELARGPGRRAHPRTPRTVPTNPKGGRKIVPHPGSRIRFSPPPCGAHFGSVRRPYVEGLLRLDKPRQCAELVSGDSRRRLRAWNTTEYAQDLMPRDERGKLQL